MKVINDFLETYGIVYSKEKMKHYFEWRLAEHFFVKYHWEYHDIDMSKNYPDGSYEDYIKTQNEYIKEVKVKDDYELLIHVIKEQLTSFYCFPVGIHHKPLLFEDNMVFICADYFDENDLDKNQIEDNTNIEEAFERSIDYKQIVDFVKTHTEEEVMEKYPSVFGNDDYWFDFV